MIKEQNINWKIPAEMTELDLDMSSPGPLRENKSRKKSEANAELTIEVGGETG